MGSSLAEQPQKSEVSKTSIWYGVTNPKWISIKAQYFFTFAGAASFQPFAVLFYGYLGLTTPQIGVIEFMNILISMLARPLIGVVADKSKRHSIVLTACIIFFLIPAAAMVFFSGPTQEQHSATLSFSISRTVQLEICDSTAIALMSEVTAVFGSSGGSGPSQFTQNRTSGRLACRYLQISNWSAVPYLQSEHNMNNCSTFLLEVDRYFDLLSFYNESRSLTCTVEFSVQAMDNSIIFIWICLLRSLAALTLGPSISLTDSIAYDMLGEQRASWGQQRMFGTLAWGVAAGIMGVVIDYTQTFTFCFLSLTVMGAVAIFIALFWLPRRLNRSQNGQSEKNVPFCQALHSVFLSPIFCINCVVAIASGMFLGILQVLWPQLIKDLGAPKLFFGMAAVVVCTFEIPSLFFAGAVVDKIGEPICFLLMFLAYAIRFAANACLTPETFWLGLPIESLHLFCFGLYFAAASRIAAKIAPPGTSSTVQALLATSYAGIGTGSGVMLASMIYHAFGPQVAFFIYAAFALFCFLVLLIIYFAYLRKEVARIAKLAKNEATKEQEATNLDELKPSDPLMSGNHDEL